MNDTINVYGLIKDNKFLMTEIVDNWVGPSEEKIILFKDYEEAFKYVKKYGYAGFEIKKGKVTFEV